MTTNGGYSCKMTEYCEHLSYARHLHFSSGLNIDCANNSSINQSIPVFVSVCAIVRNIVIVFVLLLVRWSLLITLTIVKKVTSHLNYWSDLPLQTNVTVRVKFWFFHCPHMCQIFVTTCKNVCLILTSSFFTSLFSVKTSQQVWGALLRYYE